MKLLQLNMWMGRLTSQIIRLVEREQPDIITAQEIFRADGEIIFPDRTFNLFSEVTAAGNYGHTYFSAVHAFPVAHQTAQLGNAIFSRFPITDQRTVFTHGQFNPDETPASHLGNSRNLQIVTLDCSPNKQLRLVNHHAHWEATPQGSQTSIEKMELVRQQIEPLAGPIVFAGDLNLEASSPAMRPLDGLLEDLTATHQLSTTLSTLGKVSDIACDHILVNDFITVHHFTVINDLVSDHLGLLLEFDF